MSELASRRAHGLAVLNSRAVADDVRDKPEGVRVARNDGFLRKKIKAARQYIKNFCLGSRKGEGVNDLNQDCSEQQRKIISAQRGILQVHGTSLPENVEQSTVPGDGEAS